MIISNTEIILNLLKQDIFSDNKKYFEDFDDISKNEIAQIAEDFSIGRILYFYHKDTLPDEWKNKFAQEFRTASAKELKRTNDLKILLNIFSVNKIQAALLKGNYVAHTAYPHPGLRIMCDIDILIRESQIDEANNLLLEKGYRQTNEMAHSHHKPGIRSKNGTFIELHYHIMRNKKILTSDMLWLDSYSSKILDEETYYLAPEIIILHTITHAFQELMLSGLKTFIDIAFIIKKQNPNPEKLIKFAQEFGLLNQLRIFLNLYPDFFPKEYNIKPEKDDLDIIDKTRFLIETFSVHRKTTNQERGFVNSFAGSSLKQKLSFIINSSFKGKEAVAYKYKCQNKFPEIYYWYAVSIFDGFKLFLKYLFNKTEDRKKLIGNYQRDLNRYIKLYNS